MTPRSQVKLRPWVILHNTMTLDGSISGYKADFEIHYGAAANLNAQAFLIGSQTVLDASSDIVVPDEETGEESYEFEGSDTRPYWVLVDSKGRLGEVLPFYRRMRYIKEIIVLVSDETPRAYIQFLEKYNFPYICRGEKYVNLHAALLLLKADYQVRTLVTDTGSQLNNVLLKKGLIDEISLVIAPFLLPEGKLKIFEKLELDTEMLDLRLLGLSRLGNGYIWLRYVL